MINFEIMLDVETLGQRADAKITEISYVIFSGEEPVKFKKFMFNVDLQINRTVTFDTLIWYQDNNIPFNKEEIDDNEYSTVKEFFQSLHEDVVKNNVKSVWYNRPPDFAWIKSLYETTHISTLESLFTHKLFKDIGVITDFIDKDDRMQIKSEIEELNTHDSLTDCFEQIKLLNAYRKHVIKESLL